MHINTRAVFAAGVAFLILAIVAGPVPWAAWAAPGTPASGTATPAPAAATPSVAPAGRAYTVRPGDTLGAIAVRFDITVQELLAANNLHDADSLHVGQALIIPGLAAAEPPAETTAPSATPGRLTPWQRLPIRAQLSDTDSPYYKTTWVTYYGRPDVPIMGILGEYGLDDLVPLLRGQAKAFDEANGPELGVMPAIHLVYGMAAKWEGPDKSHLSYLDDETVLEYIDRAAWEGMGLILDVQIGALTPVESIQPALKFLKYNNVQLAIDAEFAMTTPGQEIPGDPPGMILGEDVNEVQVGIVKYMQQQGFRGHKILLVHQFLPTMIRDKDVIKQLPAIDVTIVADGWGPPATKMAKYNLFMSEDLQFAGFKLFYRWDEPLMTERQALGVDPYPSLGYMEVMPSFIAYQ